MNILFIGLLELATMLRKKNTIFYHEDGKYALLNLSLFGFFNISYFSICYRHAASLTPRFSEAVSSGIINMMANCVGFIQTFIWAWIDLQNDNTVKNVTWSIQISIAVAIVIFCFIADKRTLNPNDIFV